LEKGGKREWNVKCVCVCVCEGHGVQKRMSGVCALRREQVFLIC
jgi:hypothetical protein